MIASSMKKFNLNSLMKHSLLAVFCLALTSAFAEVPPPDSLILDGIPPVPDALKADAGRYLEFRAATFCDWHPTKRELLITTRFADSMQLHEVKMPGGARRQLTFLNDPVAGASYRPRSADCIVFSQDVGGSEFFQLFRYDLDGGRITLLTDGKSRNTSARWSRSGKWLAYTSTRRNGKDNDIYLLDPAKPGTATCVSEVNTGGWAIEDWSADDTQLLLEQRLSINQSLLFLLDLKTGKRTQLTPDLNQAVSYSNPRFAHDSQSIFVATDQDAEFHRLVEYPLPAAGKTIDQPKRILTAHIAWDISEFELSPDGKTIAFIANEAGIGVLHLLDVKRGKEKPVQSLPAGVLLNVKWHPNSQDLALNVSSAKAPADVFSVNAKTGQAERWTDSETGGLNASQFVDPELIKLKSFDGLPISAFLYRPDPKKFPGKRPLLINIHGGPESQSRPIFQTRYNYLLNELGIAIAYPNVRGSSGYGKTFVTLDNGFKREDTVRDIGAIIDLLRNDPRLDAERFAVTGGSYGGYMCLASMEHFADRLRCGIDVVGISNFLTFLKNTQDYRRDLRRAEYGDERQEDMRKFLEKISPTTNVGKIRKPLLVVQGLNDPRVPATEAAQMVKAVRDNHGTAWHLVAKDEGHGFAKKKNIDFQFLVTVAFLQEFLLK